MNGTLEIKLGASLAWPTRRANALLHAAALDCNRARNAVVRKFLRWHDDHPDYEPGPRIKNGEPVLDSKGQPKLEHPGVPGELSKSFYRVGTNASPTLSTKVVSSCVRESQGKLTDKVPYNHEGKAKYRWQALLMLEVNPQNFRAKCIPVPNQDTVLVYDGHRNQEDLVTKVVNGKIKIITPGISKGIAAAVDQCGDSSCILRFPLLSRQSGYDQTAAIFRLHVKELSRGNRRLLMDIAKRTRKLKDSKLVFKRGAWFFQLCYEVPVKDHGLDASRVATLWPLHNQYNRPFRLEFPDGTHVDVGHGIPYLAEYQRVTARRKALRSRYRDGAAGRGHGRKRFFDRLKPWTRALEDAQWGLRNLAIAFVVKMLIAQDCGSLMYREPTMPLRKDVWFAQNGCELEWTHFESHLAFKMESNTVTYATKRVGTKEHGEKYPRKDPGVRAAVPAVR